MDNPFVTRRGYIIVSLCVMVVFCTGFLDVRFASNNISITGGTPQPAMEYITRESIDIYSEADLTAFPGDGTPTSPYVIAGYNITANYTTGHCVLISSSNKSIVITNCYFILNATEYPPIAVRIIDAANVTVTNNIFNGNNTYAGCGMILMRTIDVIVSGNQFLDFPRSGNDIAIDAYQNNTRAQITNNYIPRAWIGINSGRGPVDLTTDLVIANNYVGHCLNGIQVFYANGVRVEHNVLVKHQYENLRIVDCLAVTEGNNTIITMPYAIFSIWPATTSLKVEDDVYFIAGISNGTAPLTYQWDFDDPYESLSVVAGASARHQFSRAGTYNVSLTVTDGDGDSSQYSQQVVISPEETGGIDGYPFEILAGTLGIGVVLLLWRGRRVKKQTHV